MKTTHGRRSQDAEKGFPITITNAWVMTTILAALGWAGNRLISNYAELSKSTGAVERGKEARDQMQVAMDHRIDQMQAVADHRIDQLEIRVQSLEEHVRTLKQK